MTRAGSLVTALLVASAAAAAEEGTGQAASDDQADVREVALPGSTGTLAAGKGAGAAGGTASGRREGGGAGGGPKGLPSWPGAPVGGQKSAPPGAPERLAGQRP